MAKIEDLMKEESILSAKVTTITVYKINFTTFSYKQNKNSYMFNEVKC